MKNLVKNKLTKYGYNYKEVNDTLFIQLDYSQTIIVEFDFNENKVLITEKFTGLNFLTGRIHMNLKQVLIFNTIIAIIGGLYAYLFAKENNINRFILFFLFTLFANLLWYIFYFIRYYFIKKTIIDWIEIHNIYNKINS